MPRSRRLARAAVGSSQPREVPLAAPLVGVPTRIVAMVKQPAVDVPRSVGHPDHVLVRIHRAQVVPTSRPPEATSGSRSGESIHRGYVPITAIVWKRR